MGKGGFPGMGGGNMNNMMKQMQKKIGRASCRERV